MLLIFLKSKAPKNKDLDILQWWNEHKNEYPALTILCGYYLAIPGFQPQVHQVKENLVLQVKQLANVAQI